MADDGLTVGVCMSPIPQGVHMLAQELSIETRVHPTTRKILAVSYRLPGVHFHLLLGKPGDPAAWGHHRPRGLIFDTLFGERRLELRWPRKTEQTVVYTKVGVSGESPPQWTRDETAATATESELPVALGRFRWSAACSLLKRKGKMVPADGIEPPTP